MDVTDDEPKEEEELTCGWRRFTPKFLQKLNTIKWFLVFLTIYSFMQGMTANGFTAAGLTALEKRFKLSSKQTGLIVAANDVSSLFLIIFISYYGGHSHKARWLGFGALVTSLGALLFALPHVLIDKYVPLEFEQHSAGANLCFVNNGTTVSQDQSTVCRNELHSSDWKYLFVFIGAKVLLGAGTTPLFTLGPAYIDENVDPKSAPMYIGTWFIATFFGPGIGYVAGGSLLTIWVDLIQPPGLDMTPDDPRWIGAWWLGYFFGGLLLLLSAIALLGYPREMPGSRERRARAIKEGLLPPRDENISGRMKDLIPATKSLLSNMTFMANTLALCATALIATGLGPFISKFIQSQFGEPSSTAGILTGVIIIPGTAGGIFLGSYLVKRIELRKSCRQAAKYCFIFQFVGTWGVLTFLIPGCKTSLIAGINANYPANFSTQNTNMTSLCNIGCKCSSSAYFPVCGVDKTTYFSPCFAGCKKKIGTEEFDQCSCIAPATDASSFGFAKKGVCDRDCKNLIPFLFGALVLLVANFIVATPNKTVVLRCVPDNQRTYALGLQWLFLSIFGSVPGPVLFGTFIDKTCILWEDSCGRSGRCLEYDNELLSYFLVACGLFFHVLSTLFYFVSWYLIKRREDRAEALENEHENSLSEFASPVPGISGRREELTEDSTPLNQPITAHHSDIELVGYRGLDLARTPYPMTQHESSI